jgi:hypothetical protein
MNLIKKSSKTTEQQDDNSNSSQNETLILPHTGTLYNGAS